MVPERRVTVTVVSKHCSVGHLKSRLFRDLKSAQNVPNYSLFKLCKLHEEKKLDCWLEVKLKMCLYGLNMNDIGSYTACPRKKSTQMWRLIS